MLRFIPVTVIFFFLTTTSFTQDKHALLVGISYYPEFPNPILTASNDMELVEEMLSKQEFPSKNIIKIYEKNATHEGMHDGFNKLLSSVSSGDVVYYHFSGHGCQIPDIGEKDEDDGYDEVMMPYDSPKLDEEDPDFMEKVQLFFTDDEFNYYLNRLREKLGKQGQIVVVMDCCHSGTGTRDVNSKRVSRGLLKPIVPKGYKPQIKTEKSWSAMDNNHIKSDDLAGLTSFYGCRASQVNYEYPYNQSPTENGSLTYFFNRALNSLDDNATYRNLYTKIAELHEKRRLPAQFQDMLYESDNKDALVFSGEFVSQKNYLTLSALDKSSAQLDAGSIHGLMLGDTVGFFDNSEMKFERNSAIFVGVVSDLSISTSKVNLLNYLEDVSRRDFHGYRARKIANAKSDVKLKVMLDFDDKKSDKNKRTIMEELKGLDFVEITESAPDIVIMDSVVNDESSAFFKLPVNKSIVREGKVFSFGNEYDMCCLKKNLEAEVSLKSFFETKSRIDDPRINIDVRFEGIDTIVNGGFPIKLNLINKSDFDVYWKMLFVDPNHTVFHLEENLPILKKEQENLYDSEDGGNGWEYSCSGADCGKVRVVLFFSNYEIENYSSILDFSTICDPCQKSRGPQKKNSEKVLSFETQEFIFEIQK